jgi:hypothetical protein
MRALATRPQRLALGIAVLSAAALGTVTASAAQASDTATAKSPIKVGSGVSVVQEKGKGTSTHPEPPKGAAFAVAYHPTAQAPGDLNTANGKFAKCMRAQGQSVFPRFHASKDADGHVNLQVRVTGGDFDPTTAGYKKAVKVCGPILEKAGLTFPNPADLPPLPTPDKPGKPGKPGKVTSELPSLTRAFENA